MLTSHSLDIIILNTFNGVAEIYEEVVSITIN